MKRIVILGEGHGETTALPILARRILDKKDREKLVFVDDEIIRTHNPLGLVKWDKQKRDKNFDEWFRYINIASRRSNLGGVLAVFDGDSKKFPAGSDSLFCAMTAARVMAQAAAEFVITKKFSLAVVFACVEFESWLIAGTESLAGQRFEDGRPILPQGMKCPEGEPESQGKAWLERNCLSGYRPTRDQAPLTKLIDLEVVRQKKLRSFTRLDHAIEQLLGAIKDGVPVVSPL